MDLALIALAPPLAYALGGLYATARGLRSIRSIDAPPSLSSWPRVSLIVPACNEIATLEAATRTKLASDYPNLELVVVDDRSTDGTSDAVDRLAAGDPRVVPVHLTALPAGWLGKVHALHRGARAASGDWLVFSDADVHIDPGVLRGVVATAEARRADFCAVIPRIRSNGFALDVLLTFFMRALGLGSRIWRVEEPTSRAAFGSGVFNMCRRAAFERTPGFEWLRLEVVDDLALAQMMKKSGARCIVLDGSRCVALDFYASVAEMTRGIEKNGYTLLGVLRPERALAVAALLAYLELGPAAALVCSSKPAYLLAGAALLVTTVSQLLVATFYRRPITSALVPLAGAAIFLFVLVRATLLAHLRGGISWRGTFYPLDELRRGRRIEP